MAPSITVIDRGKSAWGQKKAMVYTASKRAFDLALALMLVALFMVPMLTVALAVSLTSPGPILHWSKRVGRNNVEFFMPKFRTMRVNTPHIATHMLTDPGQYLTPIGSQLRRTSLDELPQLWSILAGCMSFVGPRPALYNQADLIEGRTKRGVHALLPGLTGWAQVNGRDELPIERKIEFDAQYLERRTFGFDLYILGLTFFKVVRREGVSH